MGSNVDKAFLEFGGQTMLDRAVGAMASACESVAVVGDRAKFAKYSMVVADIFPGCGPLGGIHAALRQSSAEFNLVLAVDMPLVSGALLSFLLRAAQANSAMVTVPRVDQRLQPLCAVYRQAFFMAAERALQAGMYKVNAVFSRESLYVIEEEELLAAGFSVRSFFNVNTPHDLEL